MSQNKPPSFRDLYVKNLGAVMDDLLLASRKMNPMRNIEVACGIAVSREHGWSEEHAPHAYRVPPGEPKRSWFEWNDKEKRDLLGALSSEASLEDIAAKHERGRRSIVAQIDKISERVPVIDSDAEHRDAV